MIIGFDIEAYDKNEILTMLKECTWYYDNIEKLKLHMKESNR
ncbi:hypothetical protein [Methanobrevibacter sp.]|nr:hypothetical protein [Methanobrevibacter sp.]MDO5859106.1 hypothetical protein [Methanobrevibacter sp.]